MTDNEYLEEKAAHIAGLSNFIAHEPSVTPILYPNPSTIESIDKYLSEEDLQNWGLDSNGNPIILDTEYKGGNAI